MYDVNELFVQSHGLPDVPHDHDWTVENEKLKRRKDTNPKTIQYWKYGISNGKNRYIYII